MRRPTCLAALEQEREKEKKQEQEKMMEMELGGLVWAKVMRAIVETSRNLCLPVGRRVTAGIELKWLPRVDRVEVKINGESCKGYTSLFHI